MSICRCFWGLIFVLALCLSSSAQKNEKLVKVNSCRQDKKVKLRAIEDSENKYRIGRIEILGNIFIHDREIRQRILSKEGDIFTRKSLDQTIENFSKWDILKPVTIQNIKISLDSENKDVYMIFCVEEKINNEKLISLSVSG